MADQIIILPDDSANTGKQLDAETLTVNSKTVLRERHQVVGTTDVSIAAVVNAAPTTQYGLVTRAAGVTKAQQTDGTNSETTLFDADSGGGTQYLQGVSVRAPASGGSTDLDFNSGVKSGATLRVVIATDQPALTNKILVTPDSVALPANQSVNVAQVNGVTPLMGAGNTGTGSPRVTIASDQAAIPITVATVPSHAVTNAGTFAVQESTTLSTFMASGSDGSTALTSTAQVIKASAGQVFGWYIYNPNATAQFVHFYNVAAASVTVGTTNPLFTLTIPATAAANVLGNKGINFSNAGFSIAATSTAGANGAPGTALDAIIFYA